MGRKLVGELIEALLSRHGQLEVYRKRQMKVWVSLHCREDAAGVKQFYESLGLVERNFIRGYYRTTGQEGKSDAIEMAGLLRL